jgi:hypothetical protein
MSTILDPWAGNKAVTTGLQRHLSNQPTPQLFSNDRWTKGKLAMEPLERFLYDKVLSVAGLSMVVTMPPASLAEIALVTALSFTEIGVCMYVPLTWVTTAPFHRLQWLHDHHVSGTLLTVTSVLDPDGCWVCVFNDADYLTAYMHPSAADNTVHGHVIVDYH